MLNNFLDKYIFTGGLKYVHNNFFLMGVPFAMVPVSLLVSVAQRQDAVLDKEIYYSFKSAMLDSLKHQFGVNFDSEGQKGLVLLEELFCAFGWGAFAHSDLNAEQKRAIVVVSNSPVALNFGSGAKFPVDHFLRGVFAGLFSSFFKADVECVEAKCIALNENACEFVVKKKSEFDFSKPLTRAQLDTDR